MELTGAGWMHEAPAAPVEPLAPLFDRRTATAPTPYASAAPQVQLRLDILRLAGGWAFPCLL